MNENELKFCIHFTEAYLALYEHGLITEEQLEKVINLIDRLNDYPPELFEERLMKIFK
ncbi:MAG: hypothetical protein KAX49_08025 [Halanaerobiales bacterium]|nr:hypothetical protein [Halanaerobiales bacterium]